METTIRSLIAGLFIVLLAAANASPSEKELAKQAKLTRDKAERIALTKVPQGEITSGELEREHGKLIWSFDISKPETKNITEVQVDAKTGQIVSVKTETPKEQAAEAATEHKKH